MPKLDLRNALRIKVAGGELAALKGEGFSWTMPAAPSFDPASLFASGEQGGWYDPSDISTLFQDTAGTIPVTAVGQTVARMNDKSGRGNHATQATESRRPLYQIDSNGRPYLIFDGVDDGLSSGSVTLTGDEIQAFAGVRKLSDAASGQIVVFNDGLAPGWGMLAPASSGAQKFAFECGAVLQRASTVSTSYNAPISAVVTGIGDISSDTSILRVNGTQVGSNASDQGIGGFAASSIQIGRRSSGIAFNGRLYNLIVRAGANLDAETIGSVESYVSGKTGVTL